MTSAISVTDLRRSYTLSDGFLRRGKRTVEAVRGISFDVAPGELFGLAGPNGAGKTTTVRVLSTLLEPTAGRVEVLGLDVVADARRLRGRIGILFGGEKGLYGRVSGWHNLRYFANLYGLPTARSAQRIDELLELVGLAGRAHDRVDTYSRGMKQRLHIARTLLHRPEVLFLDEPTIGLDPVGAREIRDLIKLLQQEGHTILLTTHYMPEADELCDRLAVLTGGELLTVASPRQLRSHVSDLYVVEVTLRDDLQSTVDVLRELAGPEAALTVGEADGRRVARVQSAHWRELLDRLPTVLGWDRVGPLVMREPTLEDVYLRLVGADKPTAAPEPAEGERVTT
jgi:ABC-2 type transport system ATP-binding protein